MKNVLDIPVEVARMVAASEIIQTWTSWHKTHVCQMCKLILPLGELLNPAISGFLEGLLGNGQVIPRATWAASEALEVQAIEGQITLAVDMVTALLIAQEIAVYRCSIKMFWGGAKHCDDQTP